MNERIAELEKKLTERAKWQAELSRAEKRLAMRLWLDSERMAARQVTVLDVQRALREQNVELPSGRVENLDREMTIQMRGR